MDMLLDQFVCGLNRRSLEWETFIYVCHYLLLVMNAIITYLVFPVTSQQDFQLNTLFFVDACRVSKRCHSDSAGPQSAKVHAAIGQRSPGNALQNIKQQLFHCEPRDKQRYSTVAAQLSAQLANSNASIKKK